MTRNAIIIGPRPQASCSLHGERRALASEARTNARQPFTGRIPNEFYPTPPEAIRALLSVETFDGSIWEPACGDGAISRVFADAGHHVISTDRYPYGFGESGVDFLREPKPRAKHIVTNPPYGRGLADAFVTKALSFTRETGGKVAMLLNLASLCHPARTALWRKTRPARLYAIDGVVCWPERQYGPAPAIFTRHRYCWAIWSRDHEGPTAFDWLSANDFRA